MENPCRVSARHVPPGSANEPDLESKLDLGSGLMPEEMQFFYVFSLFSNNLFKIFLVQNICLFFFQRFLVGIVVGLSVVLIEVGTLSSQSTETIWMVLVPFSTTQLF